jgi:hypothetical protein
LLPVAERGVRGDVLHFFHLLALGLSDTISPCLVTRGWMRQEGEGDVVSQCDFFSRNEAK